MGSLTWMQSDPPSLRLMQRSQITTLRCRFWKGRTLTAETSGTGRLPLRYSGHQVEMPAWCRSGDFLCRTSNARNTARWNTQTNPPSWIFSQSSTRDGHTAHRSRLRISGLPIRLNHVYLRFLSVIAFQLPIVGMVLIAVRVVHIVQMAHAKLPWPAWPSPLMSLSSC